MIRRISTNFVPVAVNLFKVRAAQDAGGELFRSVQKQKDQYQGIWIVSPDGKVLAGHGQYQDYANFTQEVLATIESSLKAFGAVSPRNIQAVDQHPLRGNGLLPDGGVTLAIYIRHVLGGGKHTIPAGVDTADHWLWDGELRGDSGPVLDSLTLSAAEWATLRPPKLEIGTSWTVPEAVARRFSRVLSPTSDQYWMPRLEDTKLVELKAVVESVDGAEARIRFTGQWATERWVLAGGEPADGKKLPTFGQATAEGIGLYDGDRNQMRSLLLVLSGTFRHAPPYDSHRPTGAVVEWRSTRSKRG